jgi:hypothetical protein
VVGFLGHLGSLGQGFCAVRASGSDVPVLGPVATMVYMYMVFVQTCLPFLVSCYN